MGGTGEGVGCVVIFLPTDAMAIPAGGMEGCGLGTAGSEDEVDIHDGIQLIGCRYEDRLGLGRRFPETLDGVGALRVGETTADDG